MANLSAQTKKWSEELAKKSEEDRKAYVVLSLTKVDSSSEKFVLLSRQTLPLTTLKMTLAKIPRHRRTNPPLNLLEQNFG